MSRKEILCLDFDGVLHSYKSGWQGADVIPDPPVPGAIEFLARAVNVFEVCIYSSRSHQPGGIEAMKRWLAGHILEEGGHATNLLKQIDFPLSKPPAKVTIDDRALTFNGVWPSMQVLQGFQPWNKRKPVQSTEGNL